VELELLEELQELELELDEVQELELELDEEQWLELELEQEDLHLYRRKWQGLCQYLDSELEQELEQEDLHFLRQHLFPKSLPRTIPSCLLILLTDLIEQEE
jgi:hypothetical protein